MAGWFFLIYISQALEFYFFHFFHPCPFSYYEGNEIYKWEHLYGHTAN